MHVFIRSMAKYLPIDEFLALSGTLPVVDVRSPAEFAQGHIPGTVNIPLFDNDERKQVGIRYKLGGKENAVLLGLEIVGPKLAQFAKEARKHSKNKKIMVHCWRGGMRSASMAWLFETAGIETYILEGGYKAYRRYIRQQFSKPAKLIILGGYTGSGKTDILKQLERHGEQFLDIEALAHHKGSVFGPLGQQEQPTNEQFENNLAKKWNNLDFSKHVWIEDESRQLGKVGIPDPLFSQIRSAKVVKITIPKNERVKRLVKEYGDFDKNLLLKQLLKIKERLGGQRLKEAVSALENNDMSTVASLTLQYYDKAYEHGIGKRDPNTVFELNLAEDNPGKNAETILEFVEQIKV